MLIGSAVQRCRASDDVCRLCVFLKLSPLSDPPLVRISISDTGVGSSLEEFQDLKFLGDPFLADTCGKCSQLISDRLFDEELCVLLHMELYQLKPPFKSKRKCSHKKAKDVTFARKNGAKFSGTEVSLSTSQTVDNLLAEIRCFLQKMLILKMPKVAIEFVVDHGDSPGSRCENIIQTIQSVSKCPTKNIGHLESGLTEYVLKHGNCLDNVCSSCFSSGECLKIGSGVEYSTESSRNVVQVVEAVIIICELLESMSPSCLRLHNSKTEVSFYF